MPYTFKHGDRPLEGVTVQRAVGRGGFGEVYYALTDSGKQVALKYLRENPEIELRGISHVMNLKSPHLITIYDVRRNANGEPFVVMEYVSGPSLRELLTADPGGLGPQKAAFFVCGIAQGLAYLHERGIVHRDLKPANIFYDDGYVKIGDYGLSKHIAVSQHSGQTVSVGTVHYMAPEIGSGSYTKAIDIYALGVILYEMLTGRLPFTGSSMAEVLMRHLSDRPDMVGIPEPFVKVIARALAKDPLDRYQDANEMIDAIRSSAELDETIASFDHSVLSSVRRHGDAADLERTVTTPPRAARVPELDARAAAPPPLPPSFLRKAADRAERFQERLEKHARRAGVEPPAIKPPIPVAAEADAPKRRRWPHVLTLLIASVGTAVAMAMIGDRNEEEVAASLWLYMAGGTIACLVSYFGILKRNALRHPVMDRFVYGGLGFGMMVPAMAAGDECAVFRLERLIVPIVVMLAVCDLSRRIEAGCRGRFSIGEGLGPAILGLIVGGIAGTQPWIAAATCAAIALLAQSAAGLWSMLPRPLLTGGVTAGSTGATADRWGGIGERISRTAQRIADRFDTGGRGVSVTEAPGTKVVDIDVCNVAGSGPVGEAPALVADAAPSFVGRAANAGMSFLGKLLLLAGVAAAVMFHMTPVTRVGDGLDRVQISPGHVEVIEGGRTRVDVTIPKAAVILPIVFGTLLLIVSRRRMGGAHFVRAFLGGAAALVTAILAVGPAARPITALLATNDWSKLQANPGDMQALVTVAVLLGISVMLLFWPRRDPSRPLVI